MHSISHTHIVNRERVQPSHANNYESAHGGIVMKWMDEIGAMAAMRAARESCVTAQMSRVDFERPIPIGDNALVDAYAYETGRTSVKVRIQVEREHPTPARRSRRPAPTPPSSPSRTANPRRYPTSRSRPRSANGCGRPRWPTNPTGSDRRPAGTVILVDSISGV